MSKSYWIAAILAFSVAAILNLVPYYFSHGANVDDGIETMGWPLAFYECGGIDGHTYRSVPILCVDIMIAIGLALVAGIPFRNGVRPVLVLSRRLLHKIRSWPNEDATLPRHPME